MTIPALIAASLLLGASIAYGARIQIRTLQRHVFTTRYFTALMMLELIIVTPIGIYFYMFYPDWSWMYLVNTAYLNPGVVAMTFASYPLLAAMGYLVGYYSARSASDWVTLMFIGFMSLGLLGLFIAAKDQLLWVGTYEQYHRDVGLSFITSTSILPSVILAAAGIGVSLGYTLYRFVNEGRISQAV
jgi:hypothetical protein